MAFVFVAVTEQIPVKQVDIIFRQRDMYPRLENLFHGFCLPGHFLFTVRGKGMDGELHQQTFHYQIV